MKNLALISFLCFALVVLTNASRGKYVHGYYQRCPRKCSENIDIVCGTDGNIYWNECALNNAICKDTTGKLKKANNGPCESVLGALNRGLTYNPVCGSDGKTYSNVAYLDLSKCLNKRYIRVVSKGECKCKYHGDCKKGISCNIGCPVVINPVCGDDGNTYSSECVLEKQNCILGGKALKKLHNGVCKAVLAAVIGAPNFKLVCASDGNTYSNEQYIRVARCQNPHLKKLFDGPCRH